MLKSTTLQLAFLGCSLVVLSGCGGPRLSEAEIGKPIFELPKLPGSDQPYPMPELDKPADEAVNGGAGPAAAPKSTAVKTPTPGSTAAPADAKAPASAGPTSAEPASPATKP